MNSPRTKPSFGTQVYDSQIMHRMTLETLYRCDLPKLVLWQLLIQNTLHLSNRNDALAWVVCGAWRIIDGEHWTNILLEQHHIRLLG